MKVAGGWIPGVGSLIVSGGFVWTMYTKINGKIGLPFSENIVKPGMATNLAAYAASGVAMSTALSLLPGIGSVAASAITEGTCYAGFVYLKMLTKILGLEEILVR